MSPSEYEEYVAELVRQLDFGSNFSVTKNSKFVGVRQPGEYEIDVAVKIKLAGTIDFLLIVECKNWSRPVDRPVVQKLAQTRDAVAAHKAAIASPVGFSDEAIAVAQANGIALWVISHTAWSIVMGVVGPGPIAWFQYRQRVEFVRQVLMTTREGWARRAFRKLVPEFVRLLYLIRNEEKRDRQELVLVNVSRTRARKLASWRTAFFHESYSGSAVTDGDNEPGVDPRLAVSEIADDCARLLGRTIIPWHRRR